MNVNDLLHSMTGVEQERYKEFILAKRNPESLIYAVQSRVIGVEGWSYPTSVTENSHFIGPRSAPVHNTGYTSNLELKLAPGETRIVAPANCPSNIVCPVKSILFDGFANVRRGDTITAYFFNGEIKDFGVLALLPLPGNETPGNETMVYVARDMKEVENAFKLLVGLPPHEEIYHSVNPEIPALPKKRF